MPDPQPDLDHMSIGVTATAGDRKAGMTFRELIDVVSKGMKLDTPGDAPVYGELGWSQQVRSLSIRPEKRRLP